MNERIIVKCKWRDLWPLARVTAMPNCIVIERGEHVPGIGFKAHETESLAYNTEPEIEGVYDHRRGAWDIDKLYALLHDCCEELSA